VVVLPVAVKDQVVLQKVVEALVVRQGKVKEEDQVVLLVQQKKINKVALRELAKEEDQVALQEIKKQVQVAHAQNAEADRQEVRINNK
jgi:hypothetical protein